MSDFDWSGKTILIAEDELVNFRLLEVLLSKTKVKLLHGKNGLEAWEIFQKNPDINLILMDIKMPELDGYEVIEKIREINKTVPIIAQTAYAMEEEKEKSIEVGCNAYVTKPINRVVLLDLIQSLI